MRTVEDLIEHIADVQGNDPDTYWRLGEMPTGNELRVAMVVLKKREAALKLVLLWHSASPWDAGKANEWAGLLRTIYNVDEGEELLASKATTKVLCDAVREALR